MAPHSRTFAWKIPWMEEPGRLQSMGSLESDTTEWLRFYFHFSLSCIGEGNGNPLQCSCLENPRDGGAWWAAVSGVAQRWTWLKPLSSSSNSKAKVKRKNTCNICTVLAHRMLLHMLFWFYHTQIYTHTALHNHRQILPVCVEALILFSFYNNYLCRFPE